MEKCTCSSIALAMHGCARQCTTPINHHRRRRRQDFSIHAVISHKKVMYWWPQKYHLGPPRSRSKARGSRCYLGGQNKPRSRDSSRSAHLDHITNRPATTDWIRNARYALLQSIHESYAKFDVRTRGLVVFHEHLPIHFYSCSIK